MHDEAPQTRILSVDDSPQLLEGLERTLGWSYDLTTAESPHTALEIIEQEGPDAFAVVISDLRMPKMDGIELLTRVRVLSPDSVRVLLTGNADLQASIAAVNEGWVFRFLTKPCPPETLKQAVEACIRQHELVTAERVLLERTLQGSIQTLAETLSLSNPAIFGHAQRIQRYVGEMLDALKIRPRWPIEAAATLSQIAHVTVPEATLNKLFRGYPLTASENRMMARLPEVADALLSPIPRMEEVREILRHQSTDFKGPNASQIPMGSRILRVANDFALLESTGLERTPSLDAMSCRIEVYDPHVLKTFRQIQGAHAQRSFAELFICELQPGMIVAQDIKSTKGNTVIVSRGHRITSRLLDRLRNFADNIGVCDPVAVMLP